MTPDVTTLIIGAGFGGIAMGRFLQQTGASDFIIAEKAASIGGAWRDNTYPGCACDIPSHLYSYSFFPNPDWSRRYSPSSEINDYLKAAQRAFGLEEKTLTNMEFKSAHWNAADQIWSIKFANGKTISARFLISAMGPLHEPKTPDIPGLGDYPGAIVHSARWDHRISLTGKNVALIGTGASAIQLVPELQRRAARVSVFQRTPAWVLPKFDKAYSPWQRAAFKNIPMYRETVRRLMYAGHELRLMSIKTGPRVRKFFEHQAKRFINRQVKTPDLREKLTPSYEIGCKRVLLSSDYYAALEKPNVELFTGGLTKIVGDRLYSGDGESRQFDAIVFATGFDVVNRMTHLPVYGCNGVSINEAWSQNSRCFYGMAIEDFPNFFMMMGPNTGLGHNSIVIMLEAQAKHISQCIANTQSDDANLIQIKPETVRQYDHELQSRLTDTVWSGGSCGSWYQDDTGKAVAVWPDTTLRYRHKLAHIDRNAYQITN